MGAKAGSTFLPSCWIGSNWTRAYTEPNTIHSKHSFISTVGWGRMLPGEILPIKVIQQVVHLQSLAQIAFKSNKWHRDSTDGRLVWIGLPTTEEQLSVVVGRTDYIANGPWLYPHFCTQYKLPSSS